MADPDTGRILPDGEKGTLYITTLYKWGAPQIRFNVNDTSAYATETCACGSSMRRLQAIVIPVPWTKEGKQPGHE